MSMTFQSRRSAVYGRNGMVAASQPLALAAGLQILQAGGNAVDAAVAVSAALNVTEPTSCGLGGDAFALYYEAASKKVIGLNGSGRAPAALSRERLQREGLGTAIPWDHPYTVTVPGACAAWYDLVARFGRLPLATSLAPAIHLAEEGFPVAPVTAYFWQRSAKSILARALNARELTLDGLGPAAGQIFRNLGLGRSLRAIAEGGKDAFYRGAIAEAIVDTLRQAGGCLSEADLAAHTSTWDEPISTAFHNLRVWECPPNGQGLAALLALNLLETFELADIPPLCTDRLHMVIEAMRLAFADTRQYVADPAFAPAPLEQLLSKEYAAKRRSLIRREQANPEIHYGSPQASSDTVYFSVVDGEGNACSFINSNYMGFGTGIVPKGCGFSLQNRGHNFSLDPASPNVLAPGKRPYHTIIPAMATYEDNQELYASFGVMGGFMQPQGHLQVFLSMVVDGDDPQQALDRPRFCIEPDSASSQVSLEDGISTQVMDELADLGHRISAVRGMGRSLFGRGQIIRRDPTTGVLAAGSDPRADGLALGLI
jgi:gamma-glutamyltranspeptidase/glutathione hydrolase